LLPKTATFIDVYNYIANQIEYYNQHRIHTSIWETPTEFRLKFWENFKGKTSVKKADKSKYLEENFVSHKTGA
jgi:hypothetical protein